MGDLRSVAYGHTLQGCVGLAMVDGAVKDGDFAVDVGGRVYAAEASLRGFYDPPAARASVLQSASSWVSRQSRRLTPNT